MFPAQTTPEEFKNATMADHLDACLRKTRAWKSHDCRDAVVFEKLSVKTFSVHAKTKTRRFKIPPV